jgi:uroporphyrinogen-III synthase
MGPRPLEGYTVGVTADRRWREQADWLVERGAEVVHGPTVSDGGRPAPDTGPARRLVEMACAGGLDAVTLTSAAAVRALFALDPESRDELNRALNRAVVACLGGACRDAAVGLGLVVACQPEGDQVGALLDVVAAELAARTRVLRLEGGVLTLRGACAVVDDVAVRLTGRERAVLDALARRPGAVASRDSLLREVWGPTAVGPHTLEVTMARLRRKLGPAGGAVQTSARRGYRLAAVAGALPD